MLHAINGRKARLGAFRSAGLRVPLEDVVTSTVFGPIEFMSPEDARRAIDLICEALALPLPMSVGPLRPVFWPRMPPIDDALRVRYSEPDLVFADDVGLVMVIEIKWGAPLSKNELAAQWSALSHVDRGRATHVLLVQEPGPYSQAVEMDRDLVDVRGTGPWNLAVRTWRSLAAMRVLAHTLDTSEAVQRWASAVALFLIREHSSAVLGWSEVGLIQMNQMDWGFRLPWFSEVNTVAQHEGWWTND
jgi:hypothetical protein